MRRSCSSRKDVYGEPSISLGWGEDFKSKLDDNDDDDDGDDGNDGNDGDDDDDDVLWKSKWLNG